MTGLSPGRFFSAKIRALYLRIWPSLIAVALALVAVCLEEHIFRDFFDRHSNDERCFLLIMVQCLIFGPGLCMIIGMAFSLAARSVTRAVIGLVMSGVWGFVLFWILMLSVRFFWNYGNDVMLFILFGAFALPMAVLVAFSKEWKPSRLGLLLALNFWAVFIGLIAAAENFDRILGLDDETLATIVGWALTWLSCLGWLWMGLRFFDAGLAGRPVSLRRERWTS